MYGSLDLYGRTHTHTWVKLSDTVDVSSDLLKLTLSVDWPIGSSIILTSTSYEFNQTEVFTIASLSASGTEIRIHERVQHKHLGEHTHFIVRVLHMLHRRRNMGCTYLLENEYL